MTSDEEMRRFQVRGLEDLGGFLKDHGSALPLLSWYVDEAGNAFAKVVGRKLDDAPTILAQYAAALGVEVREQPSSDRGDRTLSVQGRIGPSPDEASPGRTILLVTAELKANGRA